MKSRNKNNQSEQILNVWSDNTVQKLFSDKPVVRKQPEEGWVTLGVVKMKVDQEMMVEKAEEDLIGKSLLEEIIRKNK